MTGVQALGWSKTGEFLFLGFVFGSFDDLMFTDGNTGRIPARVPLTWLPRSVRNTLAVLPGENVRVFL